MVGESGNGVHRPVLYQEAIHLLEPRSGGRYIDGTLGGGGHAAGLLDASSPGGLLLGLDRDPAAALQAAERLACFGDRVAVRQASYASMRQVARGIGWSDVQGVLLDLGVSSMQLGDPGRGFSFREDGPLDMRFDPTQGVSAQDLIDGMTEKELAELIVRYGEEPKARRIARAIVDARPIHGTAALARVIQRSAGRTGRGLHPATRTFQALRIEVNDELNELEKGLEEAVEVLAPGGRLAVIAFHSLEDRIVKRFLVRESRDCLCEPEKIVCTCGHRARVRILTRRPIRPGEGEVCRNPRSRSARLRAAERL